MTDDGFFVLARVLHVIGVVLWIGGVAFLALVVLPTLRAMPNVQQNFNLFAAIEGRFKTQAKLVTVITGLSGFFMLYWLDAWGRYLDLSFWWVHLMTLVWLFFSLLLFVIEPALARRNIHTQARRDPATAFVLVNRMLKVVTLLSMLAIAGAISGVHG